MSGAISPSDVTAAPLYPRDARTWLERTTQRQKHKRPHDKSYTNLHEKGARRWRLGA